MIKRSDSNVPQSNPNQEARSKKDRKRRKTRTQSRKLFVQSLEARQLLAGDVVPIPTVDASLFAAQTPRNVGTVPSVVVQEVEQSNVVGVNDAINTAQFVPLGTGAGQDDTIDIQGFLLSSNSQQGNTTTDMDFYSFDLRGGDILNIGVNGAAGSFNVFYEDGSFWFGTDSNQGLFLPDASPLMDEGNAVAAQVVPQSGRYFLQVAPTSTSNSYTTGLRVYRPVSESLPTGAHQILYVDFEGGIFPNSVFGTSSGLGPGVTRLRSTRELMPLLGLDSANLAQYNELVDKTVAQVKSDFASVTRNGGNGDYKATGNVGDFAITVLNSRDHADPGLNNPLVTRVIVGGTEAEAGIAGILGIAQSLDIGNFDMSEIAITPLDNFLAAATAFPIDPNSSTLDALARRIGTTVSHEAGHTFGLRHNDGNNFVGDIMDDPGIRRDEFRLGVGPDLIFGTADDTISEFQTDVFSLAEGLFGFHRTADNLAFSLTTGTVGGTVSGNVYVAGGSTGSVSGVTVFADFDQDGILDDTEPRAFTDASGNYVLGVGPGTHQIVASIPDVPSPVSRVLGTAVVTAGSSTTGLDFGVIPSGSSDAGGTVFSDDNGNGVFDAGEAPFEGVYIYLDLDGDDRPDLGEPGAYSGIDGTYSLDLPGAGTYTVRSVPEPGLELTRPQGNEYTLSHDGISVAGGPFDFGFQERLDFSDAAASFGAASHPIIDGDGGRLVLGTLIDRDFGAFTTASADGDDLAGVDDEDGVLFTSPVSPGNTATASITATNTTGSPAYLNAWADLNQNGTFEASEKIVAAQRLDSGTQTVSFDVPASAAIGSTTVRFRYSHTADLPATGRAGSGEVEDYVVSVIQTAGQAVDDVVSVPRNSTAFPLNVLANDFEAAGNPLTITNVNESSVQGQIVISSDRRQLFYTPVDGFLGRETLSYEVTDTFGNTATANVVINVTFQSNNPVAIDDTFVIPTGSSNRPLNVLENDIASTAGGLTIVSATGGTAGGIVTVISGGQSIRYTPQPGFAGSEEFTYTVQDPVGNISSAIVTVDSRPPTADPGSDGYIVDFILDAFSATNTGQAVTDVQVGDTFNLTVSVDDLRNVSFGDSEGVAAAFLDLLYNDELVSIVETEGIRYGELFAGTGGSNDTTFMQGSLDIPGLIDEIGAVQEDIANLQQHSGPVELFTVTVQALAPGVADFLANPADDLVSDTAIIDQTQGDVRVPVEGQRLGRTSVNIIASGAEFPTAVDDAFLIGTNDAGNQVIATDSNGNQIVVGGATPNRFDVLDNDVFGQTGTLQEFTIEVLPGQGTATINNNGTPDDLTDDYIQYTPFLSASGADSLVYSIVSGDGVRSTASVNLTVGNVNPANFLVGIDLGFVDATGNPISSANVGDIVGIQVGLDDLRETFGDETFVFAGFLDLLYSSSNLTPVTGAGEVPGADLGLGFAVDFGTFMDVGAASGFADRPGIIDEFGTNDTRADVTIVDGNDPRELATVYFRATATGTATATGSPADSFPFRDTLLFQRDTPVPVEQILYDSATLTIGAGGEGEAPRQNGVNPVDVNDDGFVSSIDALLIINELNRTRITGEGESAPVSSGYFTDVNGDNNVTALDALRVINWLNRNSRSTSQAEGEAVAENSGSDAVFSQLGAPAQQTTSASDDDDEDLYGLLAGELN